MINSTNSTNSTDSTDSTDSTESPALPEWTPLATTDELQPGDRKSEFVDDEPVLLVRVGEEYYCIDDVCTHDGQPLTDGPISDGEISCPRHGARFSLTTGEPTCMPAVEKIATYEVELHGGQVWVRPAGEETAEAELEETELTDASPPEGDPVTAEAEADAAPPPATASEEAGADEAEDAGDAAESDETGESVDSEESVGAAEMLEALREVIDPELMINIVDLGLIYDVRQEETTVHVDMTLTSPACPAGPQLIQQSKLALEKLEGVDEAEINLVMTPPWSPERMTDEARDQLGIF